MEKLKKARNLTMMLAATAIVGYRTGIITDYIGHESHVAEQARIETMKGERRGYERADTSLWNKIDSELVKALESAAEAYVGILIDFKIISLVLSKRNGADHDGE